VKLEIRRGRANNLVREVTTPVFLIGTAGDCDMVLGDPQFPQVHTYLFVSERGVSLRHLGIGPDLTVNGRVVHSAWLEDGDRIRTGPYEFHVCVEWPVRGGQGCSGHLGPGTRRIRRGDSPVARHRVENLLSDIRHAIPGSSVEDGSQVDQLTWLAAGTGWGGRIPRSCA